MGFPHNKALAQEESDQERRGASPRAAASAYGELYEGFLFLELREPIPDDVVQVRPPITHNSPAPSLTGETFQTDSIETLIQQLDFSMYVPKRLPLGATIVETTVFRFVESKQVYRGMVTYGVEGAGMPSVAIWGQPMHHQPFPVWPVFSSEKGDFVSPEKVAFTPSPGVMLPSAEGFLMLWQANSVLYWLFVENGASRAQAIEIAKSLLPA